MEWRWAPRRPLTCRHRQRVGVAIVRCTCLVVGCCAYLSLSLMYYWHAIRPVGLLVILFKFEAKEAERTEK
jgi:hypothetical protein